MKELALFIVLPGLLLIVLLALLVMLLLPERTPGKRQAPGRRQALRERRALAAARREERTRQARVRALREKAPPAWYGLVQRTSGPIRRVEEINSGFFFCAVEDRYMRTQVLPLWAAAGRCDWEALFRQAVREDPALRDAAARVEGNRSVYQDYREQIDLLALTPKEAAPPDIPFESYRAIEEALFAEAILKPALDSRLVCVVEYAGPGGKGLLRRRRACSLAEAAGRRSEVRQAG